MTSSAALSQERTAFEVLVAQHQSSLLAHCYRMTASLPDAEDALQETLIRAWRSFESFEGRSSVRTWLFSIATNACRRLLEQRTRRVLPVDFGPPADPHGQGASPVEQATWITPFAGAVEEPSPEARYERKESVELAFIAALQLLPPRQRAALLLRDVLAFSASETAQALDSTVASVNSALQRAHRRLAEAGPRQSQQQVLRALGGAEGRALLTEFMAAWERRDVTGLVALMAEDVAFSMPPEPTWFRGTTHVGDFLARVPLAAGREWLARPLEVNGQLAFALWARSREGYAAHSINVLTVTGQRVSAFVAFRSAALFTPLGLPAVTSLQGDL